MVIAFRWGCLLNPVTPIGKQIRRGLCGSVTVRCYYFDHVTVFIRFSFDDYRIGIQGNDLEPGAFQRSASLGGVFTQLVVPLFNKHPAADHGFGDCRLVVGAGTVTLCCDPDHGNSTVEEVSGRSLRLLNSDGAEWKDYMSAGIVKVIARNF